ncbi:N-acetylmuramoyl-L-alanine amidase [Desulfosporosinus sp. I2]|nr:N-acetylmuramoyl-L-alanine amidase [Desulfosporosinus sp. I2]
MAGFDRFETASKIAKSGWTQSDYAILAYGGNYPDALSSAPLAKKYNAPILLNDR